MKRIFTNIAIAVGIVLVGHLIAYKMFNIPQRMEFVAILIGLLFYPIIRNPLVGVYSVFVISPVIPLLRRLYYLSYARPKTDPLIIIGDALLAFILLGLYFEFKERAEEQKKVAPYIRVIIVYFVYLLVRTFVLNERASGAIMIFKNYGPPVLFFLVGTMYAGRVAHLKRLWLVTLLFGIAALVYGIKQLYFGYSEAEYIWFSSVDFTTLFIKGVARPFSFFQAPVVFADYMTLAIIAVLLTIEGHTNKTRAILLALVPLFFYGCLITSVRSSWGGVLATLVLWFTLFRVKGTRKRLAVLIGVVLVYVVYESLNEAMGGHLGIDRLIGLIIRSAPNPERMDLLVTKRTSALTAPLAEDSFVSRMILWRQLLASSVHPLYLFTGHGLGAQKADSLYFTYLAEFGYPGLIFIVWLLIDFIRKGFYVIDNAADKDVAALAKGATIMTLVFAIISITGTHIHYFPGDIYFWFWNGVIIKQAAMIRERQTEAVQT